MDTDTLGAVISIVKAIPGTAVERAEAAQEAAETAAGLAQEYGYRLYVEDTTLVIGEEDDS